MRDEEQIRRHYDGSVDIGFYSRRAAAHRTAARQTFFLAVRRAIGSAVRGVTQSFRQRAK